MPVLNDTEKITVVLPKTVYKELKKAFPKHGAVSKVVRSLVRLYLDNKPVITKEDVRNTADFL